MTDEAKEAREAARTGPFSAEGRLTVEGDRVKARSPDSAPRYRMKRSVEVFPASDGNLYLLRLGVGDDLALNDPAESERAMLSALAHRYLSSTELAHALSRERAAVESDLRQLKAAGVIEEHRGASRLSRRERLRYDRQLIYFADLAAAHQGTEDLQLRLREARVALIGCGGLGSWVAAGLSCAGIGSLVLVDDDRVELSNLNRQLLFSEAQIGELKVEAAAQTLWANNSDLEVDPIIKRIHGPSDLGEVINLKPDLVVVTADWPPHELPRWVNACCVAARIPWIGAGQFPPRLRVGPLVVPGRSACLECLERAARAEYPLYDELAAWRARGHTPDASVGPVSGVIGSLLASEAMHFLTGSGDPASVGRALLLDLRTMALTSESITTDPECGTCRTAQVRSIAGRPPRVPALIAIP